MRVCVYAYMYVYICMRASLAERIGTYNDNSSRTLQSPFDTETPSLASAIYETTVSFPSLRRFPQNELHAKIGANRLLVLSRLGRLLLVLQLVQVSISEPHRASYISHRPKLAH